MTHEELKAETLKWCNEKRKIKGMEPLTELPKGEPHDGLSCPCGKATGLFVSASIFTDGHRINAGMEAEMYDREPSCRLPEPVKEFVGLFDKGDFPELLERPELWSFYDDR